MRELCGDDGTLDLTGQPALLSVLLSSPQALHAGASQRLSRLQQRLAVAVLPRRSGRWQPACTTTHVLCCPYSLPPRLSFPKAWRQAGRQAASSTSASLRKRHVSSTETRFPRVIGAQVGKHQSNGLDGQREELMTLRARLNAALWWQPAGHGGASGSRSPARTSGCTGIATRVSAVPMKRLFLQRCARHSTTEWADEGDSMGFLKTPDDTPNS